MLCILSPCYFGSATLLMCVTRVRYECDLYWSTRSVSHTHSLLTIILSNTIALFMPQACRLLSYTATHLPHRCPLFYTSRSQQSIPDQLPRLQCCQSCTRVPHQYKTLALRWLEALDVAAHFVLQGCQAGSSKLGALPSRISPQHSCCGMLRYTGAKTPYVRTVPVAKAVSAGWRDPLVERDGQRDTLSVPGSSGVAKLPDTMIY
jgi:hypothetical protein